MGRGDREMSMTKHGEPITILLVDDDADCRSLIREAIAACAVCNAVYEVADGKEALDFVFRRGGYRAAPRPGLIYLDIQMPGLSGQDVLRVVKSSPELRDIPVVMMTGVSDDEQIARAARNGANSYTVKPTDAQQFLKTVLASTDYWTRIHQHPDQHLTAEECRQ
jgi:CheY-like chemotaxis protein